MNKVTFSFGGLILQITSENKIDGIENYKSFLCDEKPNLVIEVVQASLPEPEGNFVFERRNHKCFFENGAMMYYSSYFSSEKETEVNYACFVLHSAEAKLFVDFENGLWYSMIFDALNIPYLLLQKGALLLHCSCIEKDDEAILFTAKKQVGKSTQASLWEKFEGARIINGDRIAISKKDGGLFASGTPYCGSSKIALNSSLPVKTIVCLSQDKENRIKKLKGIEAFLNVFDGVTCDKEIEEQMLEATNLVSFAVQNVPIYSFSCTPDENAVACLKKELMTI